MSRLRNAHWPLIAEPREKSSIGVRVLVPVASVAVAAIIGAVLLLATGHSPIQAYGKVVESGFGSVRKTAKVLILATPMILTALAASVAFRMRIWNIGADGQLIVGAIFASGAALTLDFFPAPVLLPLVLLSGMIGGALWASIAGVLKAYCNTDEVISTLMLNFVAIHFSNYLIYGSFSLWRNPANKQYPTGHVIPDNAQLPRIWDRLHLGFFIAVGLAFCVWWLLRTTQWGFQIRVIGDSSQAARYAGIGVEKNLVVVLVVSAALAGLAGAVAVSGVNFSLHPRALQNEVGYTGIIVAAVARLNPLVVVPVAILLAILINSGTAMQQLGIPVHLVLVLQGIVLLEVAAGEFFLRNRVRLRFRIRGLVEVLDRE